MKKRVIKLIICVMLLSALMIGFSSAFASAATPVWLLRAKAGIAAAMLASNLIINPLNYALDDALAEGIDPYGYVQSIGQTPWESYLEQSVIKVVADTVYIDGVPYSDVWFGPDAAESLRLAGLDFASAYNILNNQSEAITYASGVGYFDDVPIYYSPSFTVPYRSQQVYLPLGTTSYANFVASLNPYGTTTFNGTFTYNNSFVGGINPESLSALPLPFYIGSSNRSSWRGYYSLTHGNTWLNTNVVSNPGYVDSSFSFDYTSGVIDDPLDPEDGLLVRVPSTYTDPQSGTVIYDIHDFTVNYPDISQPGGHTIEIDPSLNPDFQTDLDLGNGIGDLLLTIFGLDLLNKIINFAPEPTTPEPGPQPGVIDPLPDPDPAPDDPIPGTTIADTDWTKLDEILRWIQSTIDSIRHLTESLQTMLDSIFDAIQNVIQSISEIPESIRELADQILEDIELGPSKLFDKALDILKTLFLPLLLPIRAMMNLWHYVVEWIQSITSPFTWIFGIMSGTSGNMVLPIYALLAGGICISIYKALGR